jgi:hypothetical protein
VQVNEDTQHTSFCPGCGKRRGLGETHKLNMSGWGEGGGGNVQETMADVHNGGITQDERTLVPTRESNALVRQMPQEAVMR